MANDLTVLSKAGALVEADVARLLYDAFLSGRSEHTLKAYAQDLQAFAHYCKASSPQAALDGLLRLDHGPANGVLLGYRSHMVDARLTPATVNRRLTAVRSFVKLGRTLGMTTWMPEIAGVKGQKYRDTTGPGVSGTRALLDNARQSDAAKAARDVAIIRLMFDLALRRAEVAALDLEDIDREGGRIWVMGKGRAQKESRTCPASTLATIDAWLRYRPGIALAGETALFVNIVNVGRRAHGHRITGNGLYYVVRDHGEDVGLKTRPHGLRHASITAALDLHNGDVRAVQQHARHASPEVTIRYDDNRKDLAGGVAKRLSQQWDG